MAFRFSLIGVLLITSCYSFKGISIAPTIETFYVDIFQNSAFNAPPDIGIQFSESFKDIVLSSTRLNYDEFNPHIEFSGAVRSFTISSVAPEQQGDNIFGSALNRLTIAIEVEYFNNQNEDDAWNQTFSFFQDYESTLNLDDPAESDPSLSVQDVLINTIFEQINQDIFNKAFASW